MSASQVSVSNSALIKIGCADRISSMDDPGIAQLCKEQLPKLRLEVLRGHPWNFAKKRVALGVLSATPAFDYTYQFQLPNGCIRILETDFTSRWVREGQVLLCDESTANILYVQDVTDYSSWDTIALEVLALRLAADLAIPIANSINIQKAMLDAYQAQLRLARTVNAQESSGKEFSATTWTDARK
jgi:hypothetical protein